MPRFSLAFIVWYYFVMFNSLSPLSRTHFIMLKIDVSLLSPQLHAWDRVPFKNICWLPKESTALRQFDSRKQRPWDRQSWILTWYNCHVSSHMGLSSNQIKRSKEVKSVARKRTELWWRARVWHVSLGSYSPQKTRFFLDSLLTCAMRKDCFKASEPMWSMSATCSSLHVKEHLAKPLNLLENSTPWLLISLANFSEYILLSALPDIHFSLKPLNHPDKPTCLLTQS